MAGACIFGIVIRKLGQRQELSPVILLEVEKDLEVCFNNIILTFCLAVYLRIKRGEKPLFDRREIKKQ